MDMQIVIFHSFLDFFTQQVIVHERFGRLAGKLHHHTGRRVGIHIGILAGNIVRLNVYDFQEYIARFCFTGDASLVTVGDVFLCNILAATVHQFQFDSILDGFDCHLCVTFKGNVIGDLAY